MRCSGPIICPRVAFRTLLDHFDLSFLEPVVAIGLVVASIGGLLDWLAGPSTGLVQIGRERGYLPRYFQQVNANGLQLRILVAQGVVITVIGLLYAVVPTVSRAYWVFAALATEVYLIMYVLMFLAAISLRQHRPAHARGFRAPALTTMCVVGVLASLGACTVGLLPPSQLGHVSTPVYVSALLAVGTAGRRAPDWRPPASTALPAAQTRVEGRLDRPR